MEKHHPPQNTNLCSPTSISPISTTFVQADTNTFRDLVQKLTGLSGHTEKLPVTHPTTTRHNPKAPAIPSDHTGPRRSPFKLQERRQHTIRKLEIKLSLANLHSPVPSPVTPLGSDPLFLPSSGSESPSSPAAAVAGKEGAAIAERGFYLHPSPLSTPRGSDPPELLTLFPLSSPGHRDHKSEQSS